MSWNFGFILDINQGKLDHVLNNIYFILGYKFGPLAHVEFVIFVSQVVVYIWIQKLWML